MPMYDYYCEKCKKRFEEYHSAMDDDPEECPKCGGEAQRVTALNQRLKGVNFVPPPLATRKFGDKRRTPHRSPKWV